MAVTDTITMRPRSRDALVIPSFDYVDYMQFDAVISEQHGQKLTVTDNPTELGVNISDHCYVEPSDLQLVGSIADVRMPNSVDGYDSSIGRSNSAYQQLCTLQEQLATNMLQPFDIITSVKTYNNMVMTEIQMSRDKNTPLLGRFTMTFKQVITVDTQVTQYTAVGSTGRSAAPKQNSGNQQAKTPNKDEANAATKQSLIVSGAKLGKNLVDKAQKFLGGN